MSPVVRRPPSLLDVGAGVSLVLVSVVLVGLPPVSTDLQVPGSIAGVLVAAGILGAVGLVVCWIAACFRSRRVAAGVSQFVAGIALWVVMMLVAEPLLGWRLGIATVGLVSELLVAAGWFVLRSYPPVAFVGLLALVPPVVVGVFATNAEVLLGALVAGPLVAFAIALPIARAQSPASR